MSGDWDAEVINAFRGGGSDLELQPALAFALADTPAGPVRQLICRSAVRAGEVLMRVPCELTLCARSALVPALQAVFDVACDEAIAQPFRETLALALALVTVERPEWLLYRDRFLPNQRASEHSPDSFTPLELDELQSAALVERIRMSRALIDRVYDALDFAASGMPPHFSRARLVWGVHCVRSRAFAVRADSTKQLVSSLLFCPFMDLVNHTFVGPNARADFDSESDACVLVATRDIAAGDEVLRDYCGGSRTQPVTNERMLFTYGFVPDGLNPHDELYVDFRAEIAVALQAVKGSCSGARPLAAAEAALRRADDGQACVPSGSAAGAAAEPAAGPVGAHRRLQLINRFAEAEGQSRGVVPIRVLDIDSTIAPAQPAADGRAGASADSSAVTRTAPTPGSPFASSQALCLARALCATEAELVSAPALALLSAGRPVSRGNEAAASKLVWSKLATMAAAFSTSVADDARALRERSTARSSLDGADRLVLALQLRLSRKRLVESALCHYARHRRAISAM